MKKTLFKIALISVLSFLVSCNKFTDNIKPDEGIVGWWEVINYIEDGESDISSDGYYFVIEFLSNGVYGFYDNHNYEVGDAFVSKNLSQFYYGTYWVEGNHIYDKGIYAESLYDCGDFGNPGCECNKEGGRHISTIDVITNNDLKIRVEYDDSTLEMICRKISKPNVIESYRNGYQELINSRQ